MCKLELAVFATLAVLVASESRLPRDILPAGKCNTFNIEPITIEYDKLIKMGRWRVMYATEVEPFSQLDHAFMEVSDNKDGTYKAVTTKVSHDNSRTTESYTQSIVDNVIIEDTVDESGKSKHFHTYPIAISKENAVLFYRCADAGRVEADTRFIVIPAGIELSDAGRQELLDADRKQNFRGKLFQFAGKHYQEN